MALTLAAQQEWFGDTMRKGLRISSFTAVLGATSDYSTTVGAEGFNLQAVKDTLGYGSICDVLTCTVKSSTNVLKPLVGVFMTDTNRLRLLKGSAGALVEIVPGTDLAAGDQVQITMFGG